MYYSLLATSGQIYKEFVGEFIAQLLYSSEADANIEGGETKKQQQQTFIENILIRLSNLGETFNFLIFWITNNNNKNNIMINNYYFYLILIFFILIFLFFLHRPLPHFIADRWKIQIIEFLMRISNEYLGDLVELFSGPIMRNKFTRFFSSLPFYFFPVRAPNWCLINVGYIAGIKCRFYIPKGEFKRNNALIVFIHGGGWCMGRPRFYDGALLLLIKQLGLTIISIDYSLSPEVKFPVALLECEQVIEEIYNKKFEDLGIDKNKIALMGDSAGGCQCAVLCQRVLRMNRKEMIKCQILIYPVIHMLDFQSPSYQLYYRIYPRTGLLNPKMLARWYLFYLGIEPTQKNINLMIKNQHLSPKLLNEAKLSSILDPEKLPKEFLLEEKENEFLKFNRKNPSIIKWKTTKNGFNGIKEAKIEKENTEREKLSNQIEEYLRNPDICPILANNLKDHCPTMILTAGIDVLRDEGIQYAKRLNEDEVKVELKHYEDAYHGIFNMYCSKKREEIINDISNYLKNNLINN
uniref:Alpha/beta hydrolase fold-3 domain-containing protein n=1 Tax=Meloidogyne incognita TaxID=6306 RepID=A0A914NQL4_MELIC